jgi:hypothetical protein
MSELLTQSRAALVAAGITGPHQSHSRHNVVGKIKSIIAGDTEDTFGISGLEKYAAHEILGFVAQLTGCTDDIADVEGYDEIDPDKTIEGIVNAARRLDESARRGELLLIATGHPTGLLEHHVRVADSYRRAGGKILRLREDESLAIRAGRHSEIRYTGGVGCLADWGALRHTHSARPMELLLEAEPWPDVVFGDHGFAGAAVERGIPTIAIMDINDPALAVAWAEHKDVAMIPMDDNRLPRLYKPSWSIFEAVMGGSL